MLKFPSADMEFDYHEALKRQKISQMQVDELRDRISVFSHVPKTLSSKKLLCFINACENIDEALNVISTFYEIRQNCPAIFANRDPMSKEVEQCLANQNYVHLPNTPSGYSVIYHCLSTPKASNYIFEEACKTFFMTIDSLLCMKGPSNGLIILFDMQNVGYKHLLRPKLEYLRVFFRYLQEALPAKLKEMHIMNCDSFFDMVLALIKPFMKSDILNKMHLHAFGPPGMNMESFYNDYVPKSSLPKCFGGDLETLEILHKKHCQELKRMREYFIDDEKETRFLN